MTIRKRSWRNVVGVGCWVNRVCDKSIMLVKSKGLFFSYFLWDILVIYTSLSNEIICCCLAEETSLWLLEWNTPRKRERGSRVCLDFQRCLYRKGGHFPAAAAAVILVMHFEQPIVSMSVIRSYIPLQDNMVKVPTAIHCIFLLWPLTGQPGQAWPTTSQPAKVKDCF